MKATKFTTLAIVLLVVIQLCLCSFVLCKKAELATDTSLKSLELEVSLPYAYAWLRENSVDINEKISLKYGEPIIENLEFKNKSNLAFFGGNKEIFILLNEADGVLSIGEYTLKKPKDSLYLKAYASEARKNEDEIVISAKIQALSSFHIEGDKIKAVYDYIGPIRKFNHDLSLELRNKKITKEELLAQEKKAKIILAVAEKGEIYVKDYIIDGRSLRDIGEL